MGVIPVLLLLTLSLLPACSDAGGTDAGVTVRDSAGIEIVESAGRAWSEGDGWTVSAEPILQVGLLEGPPEYQFDGIAGAVLLDGGRLAVADRGSSEIRIYDGDGRHVRSLGGEGEGPGEFQSLRWIGVHHDSVLAWDSRAKRLSVFSPAGEFARSFEIPAVASAFSPSVRGILSDGTLVATPGDGVATMFAAPEGVYRGSWPYIAVSRNGIELDTIVSLPASERWLRKTATGGFTTVGILFGRDSHVTVGDELVYGGNSESYRVVAYEPDGVVSRIIRRAHEPVPVSDDEIAAEIDRRVEAYPTDPASAREGLLASLKNIEPRRTLPAFTDLLTDEAGNLWVREAHLPGDERQTWSVFDPSGRWLGTVEVPEDLRVRHISGDRLVGTWRDELDVEYVRVHQLLRP